MNDASNGTKLLSIKENIVEETGEPTQTAPAHLVGLIFKINYLRQSESKIKK